MPALSHLKISGSAFDAGLQLGRFGAAAMHEHLLDTRTWAEIMTWRGSARVATMARLVRERFPLIWSELEGLAAGLGLPFDDVFLWNCRGDLWAFAPDGCTTILLPGGGAARIVHNEDGYPGFAGSCAIAEYRIDGQPSIASFVYPGSIPGHTFAVTGNGLAITVNNIRGKQATAGVPRMVLSRAALNAGSAKEAVQILQDNPRAGSFHLAIGDARNGGLLSVEYGAFACSVQVAAVPSAHANHAIHAATRNLPQWITASSGFRQIRAEHLLSQYSMRNQPIDPLAILSDTGNADYPIYRADAADSDDENTMATADIRLTPDGIIWKVHESPAAGARFKFKGTALHD
ncbi:MAG: peptidase C45 [Castellaniella sp.]|uniref:C45 family autoproteolytic acyltransferase/hydolase n=1 Tax=Castellaniella sp. TaxID=1955812 RepID=UPI001218D425|nr:C45 family peptidase [Castellaniella sp.]TAN28506.1 MAG: peptidase C45 [Castellaniella sp.]